MEHYDGVHLTVGGYLACSGLALAAGGGYTMLAGWIPDATIWLRDIPPGTAASGDGTATRRAAEAGTTSGTPGRQMTSSSVRRRKG
jgi:hypothetical protein